MNLDDLDLRELLEFNPRGGIIRFGGRRVLLMDALALGLLRQELIRTLGWTAARGILLRFGFAHGWSTADSLETAFPWDDPGVWRRAGGRLHTLQGQLVMEPIPPDPADVEAPFAEANWRHSYEAEQHLSHLGRADEPVCWTLVGFVSGYLSRSNGKQIVAIEDRCLARGDAVCHVTARSKEEWSARGRAMPCFESDVQLDQSLAAVTEQLKRSERRLRTRKHALGTDADAREASTGLVSRSAGMRKVLELAERAAKVDATVLVTGESGAGKERIARLIHDASQRERGPFVAVNCAAMTETLLESELFGHARGAFTGATHERAGLFEAAHGGTLFLDEVGEVPPAMQAKLLRVLQEREIRRVGENKSRPVDVRVVAATNRTLLEEVKEGRYRQDLYYRLRVIELRVPPLRERKEDVLALARQFVIGAGERMGRRVSGLSPQAADQLLRYDFPGNVRELQNAIERGVALCEGERIEVEDLPEEIRAAAQVSLEPGRQVRTLGDVERAYILAVLEHNQGNRTRTAKELGIGEATLYRKLKEYGAGVSQPPAALPAAGRLVPS